MRRSIVVLSDLIWAFCTPYHAVFFIFFTIMLFFTMSIMHLHSPLAISCTFLLFFFEPNLYAA